jgi:hypothetical protein
MSRHRGASRRVLPLLLAAAIAGPSAYAYTASNDVPATQAGAGSSAVSGYTASSISYSLDATTPTDIDAVTFSISPTDGTVKVRLSPTGSWYACTNTGGAVSCDTTSPQATVDGTTELSVVAAQ